MKKRYKLREWVKDELITTFGLFSLAIMIYFIILIYTIIF